MEPSQLPDEGSKETEEKKVEEEEEKDPLEQQFKNLEREWSFFKQSNQRSTTTDVSRCSSDEHSSSTTTTTIVNEDYFQQVLLNKSPRDLMSSLQRDDQKHNDWAFAEILKERWDAIESGRLKGRRLFEEESDGGGESEMCWDHDQTDEDICNECFNLVHGSENASVVSCGSDDDHDEYNHSGKYRQAGLGLDCCYCCSLSGSSWSKEEKGEESRVIEETVEAEMQVEADGGVCSGGGGGTVGYAGYRKIWVMILTWFGVPLVMLVLGIISRKCTADQEEVIDDLVPT